MSEEEFKKKFWNIMKSDDFNLWLEDKILEVEVLESVWGIVKEIPQKPSEVAPKMTSESEEDLPF